MAEYIERTEELMLAMNAGARAIENTKRYNGAVYTKDVFSESPQEIPYLLAAKVLREVSDAPAADVAPVVHGQWETNSDRPDSLICPVCKCGFDMWKHDPHNFCPNCGAKMDGGNGVDAVPVVRCKECKWTGGDFVCYRGVMVQHKPEDFCSYGERKDGDTDA